MAAPQDNNRAVPPPTPPPSPRPSPPPSPPALRPRQPTSPPETDMERMDILCSLASEVWVAALELERKKQRLKARKAQLQFLREQLLPQKGGGNDGNGDDDGAPPPPPAAGGAAATGN